MILVTDGEQRSALAVVRSLGRAGHEVGVCSSRRRPLAGASRHCRASHLVPDPSGDPEEFTAALVDLVDQERIQMVMPMAEVSILPTLRLRELRPEVTIPFPDRDSYLAVSDKRLLAETAAEVGVPVPRQIVLERPPGRDAERGWPASLDALGWPLVLKPARSVTRVGDRVTAHSVQIVEGRQDLGEALARLPDEAYPVLVQEWIDGPGLGVFLLVAKGEVSALFGHRRLREKPPTGGVSVYRESVPVSDELRGHAERLLAHFGWTGVAMVEFKQDAATGTPYLMEVNGRFWGSLQLAIDSGVDFPKLLVDAACGESAQPVGTYRVGLRSRWLWGDVDHLLWFLKRTGRRRQGGSLPGTWTAVCRFLVPWRPGDRWEVLRPSDPGPFFRESSQWVEQVGSTTLSRWRGR